MGSYKLKISHISIYQLLFRKGISCKWLQLLMPCLVQTKFVGQRVLVCLGMLTNTGHVIGHV